MSRGTTTGGEAPRGPGSAPSSNGTNLTYPIMGYGAATAYQYPGGLNLQHIAPPPLLR